MASKHGSKAKRNKKYVRQYAPEQLAVMFGQNASDNTEILPHTSLETLRAGNGTEGDARRLAYMCDATLELLGKFNGKEALGRKVIAGMEACRLIILRGREKKRFIGTGIELVAIAQSVEIYDQLRQQVSSQEMAIALARAYGRYKK